MIALRFKEAGVGRKIIVDEVQACKECACLPVLRIALCKAEKALLRLQRFYKPYPFFSLTFKVIFSIL